MIYDCDFAVRSHYTFCIVGGLG